jgi:phage terminase large subunit-like protein
MLNDAGFDTPEKLKKLDYAWWFNAREKQEIPPGLWRIWLILAGRGFGKTRTGAETVREQVEKGNAKRIALVAPTASDARDVMIEGESGIMNICPDWNRPTYEPSKRRLTWPNGAIATAYSADEPERLRGPQHDFAWCDELAAWRYPEAWDMLQFGLRLGDDPRAIVTTTPKPTAMVKDLIKNPNTHVTKGSTYENRGNLAEAFFEAIIGKYEGTRLGRQELNAEILDDNPDALWQRKDIDDYRVSKMPDLVRVVVGVDPAATSSSGSDDTGIVVAGIDKNRHGYVLGDYTCHVSPKQWAIEAIAAFNKHNADRVVGETNNGGEMVEHTLRTVDPGIPYKAVHASRGKQTRAEPISSYYEQGRIHHVGSFPALEDQMCDWIPGEGKSPDRCLVEGTLVMTDGGNIPIENIKEGMFVLTRYGYKRVLAAGQTSSSANTISVHFSNGTVLTGTGNHPVYVEGKGFTNMDALVLDDKVITCNENLSNIKESSLQDTRHLKAYPAGDISTRSSKKRMERKSKLFIKRYGKMRTGRYPMGMIFTTKTATLPTIRLITSNVYQKRNMPIGTTMDAVMYSENTLPTCALLQRNGMLRTKVTSGTLNMAKEHGRTEMPDPGCVNNVGVNIKQSVPGMISDSALANVLTSTTNRPRNITRSVYAQCADQSLKSRSQRSRPHVPVSVLGSYDAGRRKVYNLTVEDCNEYFANEILVHNCDALVWALTELLPPEKPRKSVPRFSPGFGLSGGMRI